MDGIKAPIPVGRRGQPEDFARRSAILANDDAGIIIGGTFAVNDGQYLLR